MPSQVPAPVSEDTGTRSNELTASRWVPVAQAAALLLAAWWVLRLAVDDTRIFVLVVPATLLAVTAVVLLAVAAGTRTGGRAEQEARVRTGRPTAYPSVDVLLRTSGKSRSALPALEWPGEVRVLAVQAGEAGLRDALQRSHGWDSSCTAPADRCS